MIQVIDSIVIVKSESFLSYLSQFKTRILSFYLQNRKSDFKASFAFNKIALLKSLQAPAKSFKACLICALLK